jgi:hypothetical protein
MVTTKVTTWIKAVNFLVAKGMKPVSESPFSDQNRVYFAYGTNDVFLDHSATITEIDRNEFYVSDFSNSRKV